MGLLTKLGIAAAATLVTGVVAPMGSAVAAERCPTGVPQWTEDHQGWRFDGRGPDRGPMEWFTGPSAQPSLAGNPLSGKQWFVDCNWGEAWMGARRAEDWSRSAHRYVISPQKPEVTSLIANYIAKQPIAKWIGPSRLGMYQTTFDYLSRTAMQAPGATRFIVFRRLESGNCRRYAVPNQTIYGPKVHAQLVDSFARAVRDANQADSGGPLVVVIEPDVLASVKCTLATINGKAGRTRFLNTRLAEISHAVGAFSKLPNTTAYVDAGASDYVGWKYQVNLLKRVGINRIRGFSLNVTHYDWTRDNIEYGNRLAKALGVHFVVSTGRAGGGNLPDALIRRGYERGCNIPNAGLGPAPTVRTASRYADAYLWLLNPGFSDGNCQSGRNSFRTSSVHWTQTLALRLIRQRCQTGPRCYGRGRPSFFE